MAVLRPILTKIVMDVDNVGLPLFGELAIDSVFIPFVTLKFPLKNRKYISEHPQGKHNHQYPVSLSVYLQKINSIDYC